ncbi:hypothetical protein GCM10010842_38000 [Deinococcus daejeonensis]|uniref:Urease subunit gamma n=1 Tax=Deinococcus daejeonensis TaxID=1007098 RepID=A0ABQ2JI73_9DEIO|nr:hypothetical protein GCM10010842_38000 [Deinococcus daejeonensis]
MQLTERERDKLLIHAAQFARDRRARGLRLNHPEAVAFITSAVLEGIRDGRRVEDLISWGATLLTPDDVMDGVLRRSTTSRSRAPSPTAPTW